MATKIKKIIIDVNGKKIELSKKEAVELKSILEDMFGGKVVVEKHYDHYRYRWPNWDYTYWITPGVPTYTPGTVWGETTSDAPDTLYLSATSAGS